MESAISTGERERYEFSEKATFAITVMGFLMIFLLVFGTYVMLGPIGALVAMILFSPLFFAYLSSFRFTEIMIDLKANRIEAKHWEIRNLARIEVRQYSLAQLKMFKIAMMGSGRYAHPALQIIFDDGKDYTVNTFSAGSLFDAKYLSQKLETGFDDETAKKIEASSYQKAENGVITKPGLRMDTANNAKGTGLVAAIFLIAALYMGARTDGEMGIFFFILFALPGLFVLSKVKFVSIDAWTESKRLIVRRIDASKFFKEEKQEIPFGEISKIRMVSGYDGSYFDIILLNKEPIRLDSTKLSDVDSAKMIANAIGVPFESN